MSQLPSFDWSTLPFRAPRRTLTEKERNRFPRSSAIKINPNFGKDNYQRILNLLERKVKPTGSLKVNPPPPLPPPKFAVASTSSSSRRYRPAFILPSPKKSRPIKSSHKSPRKASPRKASPRKSSLIKPPLPLSSYSRCKASSTAASSSAINNHSPAVANNRPSRTAIRVFQVIYGKHKPYKKHKQWTDDGFAVIQDNVLTLLSTAGIEVGRTEKSEQVNEYDIDSEVVVGLYECQISDRVQDVAGFVNGAFFSK